MTLSVADRLELSDLVHRYAAGVDARRIDDVAELFTGTAVLTMPAPPEVLGPHIRHDGPDGVRTAMASLADVLRTQHAIVGEVYARIDDDAATGSIAGIAHHWIEKDGRLIDLIWHLRYADRYLRTDRGWRFAERALSIDAIATQPVRTVRR
ncbi:nuclear transport factor 2 family protein [Nocardia sp. NPDC052254]|uniref:nuclear transport factor 2 family protein n=1 Tax=Nocardia sp. NPDC052254 TaxID=3155681 RepID=UPI0034127708